MKPVSDREGIEGEFPDLVETRLNALGQHENGATDDGYDQPVLDGRDAGCVRGEAIGPRDEWT